MSWKMGGAGVSRNVRKLDELVVSVGEEVQPGEQLLATELAYYRAVKSPF